MNKHEREKLIAEVIDILCEELDRLEVNIEDIHKWYKALENTEKRLGEIE